MRPRARELRAGSREGSQKRARAQAGTQLPRACLASLARSCTDVNLLFLDKEQEDTDEDLDFRALENGFVSITPLPLHSHTESETLAAASEWISAALLGDTESSTQS
ncbi:hypothetical protein WN943_024334 [Citrus x changshan-huyou]